ncbi:MAG: hypothetical protein WBC51_05010 [Vicinamibacterales bacterium]
MLDVAESLVTDQRNAEIVVVTAQMACEIQIELAFAKVMAARSLGDVVAKSILDLLPSRNIANERVRRLYTALSGDSIQHQAFWPAYVELSRLRNRVIHSGARATLQEARAAIEAARELTSHVSALLARPEWR